MTVQCTLYNVKHTMYILYNLLIVFNLRNVFAWICENLFCMFSFLFLKGTNDGRIFYFSVWRMINFCLPLYLVGTVGTVNLWNSKTTFKKNVYLMCYKQIVLKTICKVNWVCVHRHCTILCFMFIRTFKITTLVSLSSSNSTVLCTINFIYHAEYHLEDHPEDHQKDYPKDF